MPGLFDSQDSGGGILGGLARAFANVGAGAQDPSAYLGHLQQLQSQQDTYKAMQQLGVPEPLARAGAQNPQAFMPFMQPYLDQAPKVQIQPGPFGQPIALSVRSGANPSVKSLPIEGGANGTMPGTMADIADRLTVARDNGANVATLLKQLPTTHRDLIRAELEGRHDPKFLSMRQEDRDNVQKLAQIIDPTFDPVRMQARQTFQREYMSQKRTDLGGQLNSLGKVLNHLEETTSNVPDLHNIGTSPGSLAENIPFSSNVLRSLNAIGNTKGKYAEAVRKIKADNQIYGAELENYLTNGKGTGAERSKYAEQLDPNLMPSEFAGTAGEHLGLILGQMQRLQEARDQTMGGLSEKYPIITPHMQQQIEKIKANIATLRGNQPQQVGNKQEIRYYQGKAYTRGPNGEAVPVQ